MSVDYSAIVAIGKEFDDKYEAQNFLESNGVLSEEDLTEIEEGDGFEEWLYNNDKIGGQCLDCYNGDYYYVGFDISVRDVESFRKSFEEGMEQWDKLFPSIVPDVIKTIRVS
jgi:hypothetical protein